MNSLFHAVYRFSALLALSFIVGCATAGPTATVTSSESSSGIAETQAISYNGPRARIAATQVKDKTGASQRWWNSQIGDGMADQVSAALFNTNRFVVLERQASVDVLQEEDLGTSRRVRQATAPPIGQIEGAELLIVGAVTEFEGAASGGGGGSKQAHMAIDFRIVDAKTSRIVAATRVEGTATDANLEGLLGGYGSAGALVGSLWGWKNTPIEKALRICIQKAVEFISSKTPPVYYRYGGNITPVGNDAVPAANPPIIQESGRLSKNIIRQMQVWLSSLGYDVGTPDGIAGKKTRAAVTSFQHANNLPVSGELTPDTITKLREQTGH
jgi:curli biogenesis system outer membrane secretion channel CsgG